MLEGNIFVENTSPSQEKNSAINKTYYQSKT